MGSGVKAGWGGCSRVRCRGEVRVPGMAVVLGRYPWLLSLRYRISFHPAPTGQFVWVYDRWMNTPPQEAAHGWYSWPDSAHHCNF